MAKRWLTDQVKSAALQRVEPWRSEARSFAEYFNGFPNKRWQRSVQSRLRALEDGDFLVAVLPPKSGATCSFDGGWTVLHERLGGRESPSVLLVRKGAPIKKVYRFLISRMSQVGDTFNMFGLLDMLRSRLHHVEFYFEHDMSFVMPGAHNVSELVLGAMHPFAGVFNYDPESSEISRQLYWNTHVYSAPIEIAKRMSWLPATTDAYQRPPEYPVSEGEQRFADKVVNSANYVVLVPKSGYWTRDWPIDRFWRLAQFLDQHGVTTVVVGKNKTEIVAGDYEFRHLVDLQGETKTIGQVAAVMRGSKLVVAPDTGLTHVALSLGCNVVSLWGPSVPEFTTLKSNKVVHAKPDSCRGCYRLGPDSFYKSCSESIACMKNITVGKVMDVVGQEIGIDTQQGSSLSVCMMVKNEEEMLPDAIKSIRPLADEIIVVDTGSTDGTVEWVKSQPDIRLYTYDVGDQIQSFSEVRNFAFSKATKRYTMWLDACERMIDAAAVRRVVNMQEYDCYCVPILHSNIRYVREKIVLREFAQFVDPIHEYIPCGGLCDGTLSDHLGARRVVYEKRNRESSASRNVRLLKKQLEEHPDSDGRPRWLFHLGRDLCDAGRYDEAIPYLKDRLELGGFYEERYAAGVLLGRAYLYNTKDMWAARLVAERLIGMEPRMREGHYIMAESYYWDSQFVRALGIYQKLVKIPRQLNRTMWVWEETYTWLPHDRISRCQEYLGQMDEAVHSAEILLQTAPKSEHGWIVERIKKLSGVATLV